MKSYNTLSLEKIAARINIKKRPSVSVPIPQVRPAPTVPIPSRLLAPSAPTVPLPPRPQQLSTVVPLPSRPQTLTIPLPPKPQQLSTVVPLPPRPPLSGSYTLRTNTLFPYNYNRNSLYTLPANPILQGSYITPKIEGAQPRSYTLPLRTGAKATPGKWKWSDLIDYGADAAEVSAYLWGEDEDDNYAPSIIMPRRRK